MGIERLTHPPGVSTTNNFFASHEKNEQFKAQLRILEEELHLTTWNLTSSFVSAMAGSFLFYYFLNLNYSFILINFIYYYLLLLQLLFFI